MSKQMIRKLLTAYTDITENQHISENLTVEDVEKALEDPQNLADTVQDVLTNHIPPSMTDDEFTDLMDDLMEVIMTPVLMISQKQLVCDNDGHVFSVDEDDVQIFRDAMKGDDVMEWTNLMKKHKDDYVGRYKDLVANTDGQPLLSSVRKSLCPTCNCAIKKQLATAWNNGLTKEDIIARGERLGLPVDLAIKLWDELEESLQGRSLTAEELKEYGT